MDTRWSIAVPVQWGDQDAFDHVNNVVYFRWFESARIAYFRRMGLMGVDRANGSGRSSPRPRASTASRSRSRTRSDVGIRVTRIGRTSIGFEHRIVSEEQEALAAEGISTTVVINYDDNRPHPVPDTVRQAIAALEGRAF